MFNIGQKPEPKPDRDPLVASGLGLPMRSTAPDLDTQLEDLLHQVYDSEHREQLMDRVDQAVHLEELREKRRRKAG
jgi:hypothetical protein